MLERVREWINKKGLISHGDKIIVGLSGGADSVCLLRVLCDLRCEYGITLYAVHVNHGIRGEQADNDERFSMKLAESLDVQIKCISYPVPELAKEWKMTEEEAGRKVRYEVFEQERMRVSANKIAVAHHQNDQAETILFRMCRGTGIKGMIGIPELRDNIIRPLSNVNKSEIYAYLELIGQNYCEDLTNNCIDYDRNRLRHNVIPELECINEHAVRHISDMSNQLSVIYDWLRMECDSCYKSFVTEGDDYCEISNEKLSSIHPALAGEIIRSMIAVLTDSLKDVEMRHIVAIQELTKKESGKRIDLPYNLVAEKQYNIIRLFKKGEQGYCTNGSNYILSDINIRIGLNNCCKFDKVYLPDKGQLCDSIEFEYSTFERDLSNSIIPKNNCTKWFDCDKIKNKLIVRRPQNDDYFIISNNCSKQLTRYFIDCKIPRKYRNNILVFADGNHILWVVGGRTSQGCYVDDNTSVVLQLNVLQ